MFAKERTRTLSPIVDGVPVQTSSRPPTGEKAATRRTTLTLPETMTIGAWQDLGKQIHTVADSSAWWLGDWLLYGQAQYPNRYKHAIKETSLDYQTLRNYAWVARRFTPDRRRAKLSFQHHAEAASLPDEEQDSWLSKAEQHGWSRNELRRRIRQPRQLAGDAEVTHLRMNLPDSQKQRWQEAAQRADQDLLAWIVATLDRAAVTEEVH
jgi:hypothetical protein